jgi:hypothetical protein
MMAIKSSDFCDRTSCTPGKVNRSVGGIYRIYLQDEKVRQQETNMKKTQGGLF